MGNAVQVRGKDAVIGVYNNAEVEGWAILQGRQLLLKGIGEDELRTALDLLLQGSQDVTYTLCVYDDVTEKKQINSKTPYDSSINFRLNGEQQTISNSQYTRIGGLDDLRERMDRLEQIATAEPEEDEFSIGAIFKDLLREPTKLGQLIEVCKNLLSLNSPQLPVPSRVGSVPGTTGDATFTMGSNPTTADNLPVSDQQKEYDRLAMAIDTLNEHDPKMIDHLEKLAKIAAGKKQLFNTLIATLDTMSI